MNRNLDAAPFALAGAVVGFFVANPVVYGLLSIQPGDRTDLLWLALITVLFAAVAFWWRRSRQ